MNITKTKNTTFKALKSKLFKFVEYREDYILGHLQIRLSQTNNLSTKLTIGIEKNDIVQVLDGFLCCLRYNLHDFKQFGTLVLVVALLVLSFHSIVWLMPRAYRCVRPFGLN